MDWIGASWGYFDDPLRPGCVIVGSGAGMISVRPVPGGRAKYKGAELPAPPRGGGGRAMQCGAEGLPAEADGLLLASDGLYYGESESWPKGKRGGRDEGAVADGGRAVPGVAAGAGDAGPVAGGGVEVAGSRGGDAVQQVAEAPRIRPRRRAAS